MFRRHTLILERQQMLMFPGRSSPVVFPGGHRSRVTPVPIPNTEVKPATADGTAWVTVWESRSPPGLFTVKSLSGFNPDRLFSFVPRVRPNG